MTTKPAGRKPRAAKSAAPVRATTPPGLSDVQTREVLYSKRFLAADRADMAVAEIATWDRYLLREHRLLVPVDVQALYVPPGSKEAMLRLPMLLAGKDGQAVASADDGMPPLFAPGEPRPAGVHLHWAMPDALLRGRMTDSSGNNKLGLPALPDRWLVLRLLLPAGGREVVTTGWVLEADRAVAVPLGNWTEGGSASTAAQPQGVALSRTELTGTAGGGIAWAGVYDAVLNRFAFHDTLNDVAALAPKGVDDDCASYVVAGWWSDPKLDPLNPARSEDSLDELLARLRWHPLYEWGSESAELARQKEEFDLKKALGLETKDYWSSDRPLNIPDKLGQQRAVINSAAAVYTPLDKTMVEVKPGGVASVFASQAARQVVALPWQLRASLLHGTVYGVPVKGAVLVDRRPPAKALSVAVGLHDDDLVSSLAAKGATPGQLRATERLMTAFSAQKINRLASPDGLVELEEFEHAAGYASLPAGSAGNDRFIQRVQTGGVGGLGLGRSGRRGKLIAGAGKSVVKQAAAAPFARHAHPLAAARPVEQDMVASSALAKAGGLVFASSSKPTLIQAGTALVNDIARSRVGEVLAPTEARIVDRPAPRWTFATEPMIGIRGVRRSLRHGGDGRASADGTLTCRWPTQVIESLPGLVAKDRFIKGLGNGGLPAEALKLAREALLHDPYHDSWLARAIAPAAKDEPAIFNRLQAETLLRFGVDGSYDGATTAFHPGLASNAAARLRASAAPARQQAGRVEQQRLVADELHKFSLYQGADPDPVGITTWSQPWVPMWMEWQVELEGVDPPTLAAWRLDAVDLERLNAKIEGDSVSFSGRSLVTTGAGTTLGSAIVDWLKAEDALDAEKAGLVDEATEQAYRDLDAAVQHLDLVSAALDGLRAQLLGFDATDGLRRPPDGNGGIRQPSPLRAPRALLAGALSLKRLRLVDAFGRTLEVPQQALKDISAPSRATDPTRPDSLGLAPRLLRPARWLFRWVEAGTPVGAEGSEARVDQIEPALMINPVAGFLLPDHLDESLELFSIDGSPVGELLHEAVSGGVVWEIAAGRDGPADAGPHHGLAPAQTALANFAAAVVAADAAGRALTVKPPTESALSALLRAIDTTLWTVDSLASLGSEHVAGLVGRPVAVVRAQLRLELKPPDDVDLSDPTRAAEWQAAEQQAQRHAFEVRIGEVTRSDDGVLGFFVNDDYSRFRLVDKVIAATAAKSGRSRGKLELLGRNTGKPQQSDIDHPYIAGRDADDTLRLHIGQTVTLTILMNPAGKCSLTSGILPRKALSLARDWVGPGLARIAPSLRTGPVLVETDLDLEGQVRLPKVSVFGTHQNFLWRDTPATWRTDAILAATQTALLPETPAELREGWIRVAPETPEDDGAAGAGP